MTAPTDIGLLELGEVDYGRALALQYELRNRLGNDGAPENRAGFLLALEHPPVVTLGKRGETDALLRRDRLRERGVDLYEIDRGGEATYHGPGQLVLYPILKLAALELGVVDVVRGLARIVADKLGNLGIAAAYDEDHPGLWTSSPRAKIASVGMRVKRGITTHGAAINLTNDLAPFDHIVACGMPDARATRVVDHTDADDLGPISFARRLYGDLEELLDAPLVDADVDLPAPDQRIEPSEAL
ncbi:MAG: lipoyl(octanoyl) transferase LipB [Bradymonadaceae bacterium]